MSIYIDLIQNPPELDIKKDAKEVIFTVISCMCDNISYINFNDYGNGFRVKARLGNGMASSLSNYQMEGDYKTDLQWASDDQDWNFVINKINNGTCKIQSVRSR